MGREKANRSNSVPRHSAKRQELGGWAAEQQGKENGSYAKQSWGTTLMVYNIILLMY